jgi:hypothetical protein
MLKLTPFDRKSNRLPRNIVSVDQEGATLRVFPFERENEKATTWVPKLVEPVTEEETFPATQVKVEIRAKRFGAWDVEDDRYSATVTAPDSSPAAIVRAVSDMVARCEGLARIGEPGGHIRLEISLTA